MNTNINFGLHGARKLGMKLQGIDASAFQNDDTKKILEVMFQILRYWLENKLNNGELLKFAVQQKLPKDLRNSIKRQDLVKFLNMDAVYEKKRARLADKLNTGEPLSEAKKKQITRSQLWFDKTEKQ